MHLQLDVWMITAGAKSISYKSNVWLSMQASYNKYKHIKERHAKTICRHTTSGNNKSKQRVGAERLAKALP